MRILLVAAMILLAGCAGAPGNEDEGGSASPSTTQAPPSNGTTAPPALVPVSIDVALTGAYPVSIAYDPVRIEVKANNEVTIVFTNNDQNPVPGHNWVLEGVDGAATSVIQNGQTTEVTFPAPAPGEYTFFCSVGDHRDRGMVGTFVVTA